jgi:hypothetical protein
MRIVQETWETKSEADSRNNEQKDFENVDQKSWFKPNEARDKDTATSIRASRPGAIGGSPS